MSAALREHERATILMGINALVKEAEYWANWYRSNLPQSPHGLDWAEEAVKMMAVRAKIEQVLAEAIQ